MLTPRCGLAKQVDHDLEIELATIVRSTILRVCAEEYRPSWRFLGLMEPPAVGRLLGTAFGRQFTSEIVITGMSG